jgi:hypothetical protein
MCSGHVAHDAGTQALYAWFRTASWTTGQSKEACRAGESMPRRRCVVVLVPVPAIQMSLAPASLAGSG